MLYKKDNIFKYFIVILLVPILGTAVLFYYSFTYIQSQIEFINHEIVGVKQVKNIHETVEILQEYRTLLYSKDKKNLKKISAMNKKLQKHLEDIDKAITKLKHSQCSIPNNIQTTIYNLKYSMKKGFTPDSISLKINELHFLLQDIAFASNLILDPNLDTYLHMKLTLFTLPKLQEKSSIMENCQFLSDDIDQVVIKISKLESTIAEFQHLTSKLPTNHPNRQNIINIQSQLVDEYKNMVSSNIFMRNKNTKQLEEYNKELLIAFYNHTYKNLTKLLNKTLQDKKSVLLYIFTFTIAILLFLLYINKLFYSKNKEFINRIEELSLVDSMTNLYNRRHFDTIFPIKQKTQKRRDKNLIFMMIDIDNFKLYNDTYGHDAGDTVITSIAHKLQSSLHRSTDIAFRLGGEEFGILLEDMDREHAVNFANKLLHTIEDMHIIHEKNSPNNFATISVGLSVIPPNSKLDMKKIYQLTDKALYHSKENGRNQVTFCKRISEE
jgi:diguanylate cyclase (GGDEF)-like protein